MTVQLNPSFEPGETIDQLVDDGTLHPECRRIFQVGKDASGSAGKALRLHRHQVEAVRAAGPPISPQPPFGIKRTGLAGYSSTGRAEALHLARWWNPAVEDQCTDRVYRIGQERDVHVYHVLAVHPEFSEHSFDVRLASLIDKKRGLSRTLLAPPAATDADLKDLYRDTVEGS
jgi:hypothetical protein